MNTVGRQRVHRARFPATRGRRGAPTAGSEGRTTARAGGQSFPAGLPPFSRSPPVSRAPFVTRAEIQARHPRELAVLAADEKTREIDTVRVDNACLDASVEIRGILASRYTPDDLERVDAESGAVLRLYAIDIALYRVALSFSRSSETIEKRYAAAIARLRDMAAGKGALTVAPAGGMVAADAPTTSGSPNEVVIDAPERLFTRRRFGGAA